MRALMEYLSCSRQEVFYTCKLFERLPGRHHDIVDVYENQELYSWIIQEMDLNFLGMIRGNGGALVSLALASRSGYRSS